MSFASRRLASVAVGTVLTVISGLAGQVSLASAADPITNQAAPTLTGPADDSATAVKDVVLTWSTVQYATKYEIQLSPNGDWTNNVVTLPNNNKTVNTTYEVPVSLPHDEYFWRVRGLDAGGHTAWSTPRTFLHEWDAPSTTLLSPVDSNPSFSWTPVPEASLYEVKISTDASFPDVATKTAVCLTAATSFTPYTLKSGKDEGISGDCMKATDLADDLNLFWQVRPYDNSVAPKIAADNGNDNEWACAEVQPECDGAVQSGQFHYTSPAAGAVVGTSIGNLKTTWHTTTLPGTDCTSGDCPTTPTFSWDPVAGANFYRVFVYRDPLATNVYRVYDTLWPMLTPRDNYLDAQAGHGYYWSVQAGTCTNSGSDPTCDVPVVTGSDSPPVGGGPATKPVITFTAFSAAATFDKSSGTVPLLGPADAASTTGRNVTFTWGDFQANGGSAAYDARNYRVQVATDPSFDDGTVVLDDAGIDMTRFTNPAKLLPDGLYYWRVQPVDESGNGLTWSATRSFTKDGTPPVFRLTDKDGIPVDGHLHAAVNEPDLVGTVSQSTLNVVPVVGNAGALAGSWHKTGDTHWTFVPDNPLVVGQSYALVVVGSLTDQPGNLAVAKSSSVRATMTADDSSPAWEFSGTWTKHSSSQALGGTFRSGSAGHAASLKVVGSLVKLFACRGPAFGKLSVLVDGVHKTTVNEHQSFTKCGVLVWKGNVSGASVHRLKLVAATGTADFDRVRVG